MILLLLILICSLFSTILQGFGYFLQTIFILCEFTVYGVATSFLAQKKGYDKRKWFFFGFFGGIIALLVCGLYLREKEVAE
ncbi:MAG: hypothetical protein J5726_01450 [Treponema sp.]|nr:hypothetical protein [Treponema sp.]